MIKRIKKNPWNKGFTKDNHLSVYKISQTMKCKKIDNFAVWRERMKKSGYIKSKYPCFYKNQGLAELIGVILGDGHIESCPRTERLLIFSHSENKGFINRYAVLVQKIFQKKPSLKKINNVNCVRIGIYEKYISKRLGVPTGSRQRIKIKIPKWIWVNKKFLIACLRGLYEAEGCFSIHKPTYTYKLIFTNCNKYLLDQVYLALKILRFNPHRSKNKIQLSQKEEVYKFKDLICYREYNNFCGVEQW